MLIPERRWEKAPAFAEVAETLGVDTVDVMAVLAGPSDESRLVLFTPAPGDGEPMVVRALLGRDADGILRAGPRTTVSTVAAFMAEVEDAVERILEEEA